MTEAALQELQFHIDSLLAEKEPIQVLEAGCGSATYLKFTPKSHFVGIDISQEQLDRNSTLDQKILGDVQTYAFPQDTFDVIICWNVLEHVEKPEMALVNFSQALKPGGILILSLPNLYSVKGLLARFTPHWFHVFVYRYGYGIKDAGKNDRAPFRTYLRPSTSPGRLRQIADNLGMDEKYFHMFSDDYLSSRLRSIKRVYRFTDRAAQKISHGRLGESEFHVVFQKRSR